MKPVTPPFPTKIIKGAWWDSQHPSVRCTGELLIGSDGEAELVLETVALHSATELPRPRQKFEPLTFLGHDQHGHPWTLFGCVSAGSQTSIARVEQRYNVTYAVLGLHRAILDEVTFDEIEIDFTDLQEWLCTPLLNEQHPRESNAIRISLPSLDTRTFPTERGYSVTLRPWIGESANHEGLSFSYQQNFALLFQQPATLRQLSSIVLDLQWFLTLGQGEPVRVLKVTGRRAGITLRGYDSPQIIGVYHRWPGAHIERRSYHRFEMLFTFDNIAPHFATMLDRWHAFRDSRGPVLSCYFATRFNKSLYSNQSFLFLAHALELYHRFNFPGSRQPPEDFKKRIDIIVAAVPSEEKWLRARLDRANELTLADRLHSLLENKKNIIGNLIANPAAFVASVKDTRNYYTHYNDKIKTSGRVASGVDLLKLTVQMRSLLEACILNDLGAPPSAIAQVLKDDHTYISSP